MHDSQRPRPSRVDRWGVRGQDRPFEAVEDAAHVHVPVAGGLSWMVRELARRVGAEVALLASADEADGLVEVLSLRGVASGLEAFLLSAGDGFVGRVLRQEASFEAFDPDRDDSLGGAASGARLTHAAGVAVRAHAGPPAVLCVGFASAPSNRALTLWIVESYARLASMQLLDRAETDRGLVPTVTAESDVRGVGERGRVIAQVSV